jgi:anti-sigma B factor antagonist
MDYTVEYHNNRCAVVSLKGRLDASTAQDLRKAILTPIEQDSPRLVADLSGVDFIDSSGLSAFVSAFRAAREQRGTVVLVDVPQQAAIALKQTGLIQLFQTYDDVKSALEAISENDA